MYGCFYRIGEQQIHHIPAQQHVQYVFKIMLTSIPFANLPTWFTHKVQPIHTHAMRRSPQIWAKRLRYNHRVQHRYAHSSLIRSEALIPR